VPYNEALAEKVRHALAGTDGLTEKKMFGGIAFLVNGAMCVGVDKDDLIVRCEKEETDKLLARKGVREFDLSGGRPMKGWLLVGPAATGTAAVFRAWIAFALAHAAKASKTTKRPAKRRATTA
jgi:TfoX/Sxy family transcriptional regulator of competence genes